MHALCGGTNEEFKLACHGGSALHAHRQRRVLLGGRRAVGSRRSRLRRSNGGCGWSEAGDARIADGNGRARVDERVLRVVQEVQRQRQLVVRLRNAPIVRLQQGIPSEHRSKRPKRPLQESLKSFLERGTFRKA